MTKLTQQLGWKLIKGGRKLTFHEWVWSGSCSPHNREASSDHRLTSGAHALYFHMVGLDWYHRSYLKSKECPPLAVADLAAYRRCTPQTIYRQVAVLVASGWAEKVRRGYYRPLRVCPRRERKIAV